MSVADARSVLGKQYDVLLALLEPPLRSEEEISGPLGDELRALGMMVIQVVGDEVRSSLGERAADEMGCQRRQVLSARSAMRKAETEDGRADAAERLRTMLVHFRKADIDELLPKLEELGADLDHLGELMLVSP